jgi:hypothetical protein
MRKLLAPAAVSALALGLAGCGSPCQDLADRICDCQPAGALRDNCKSSVSAQVGSVEPTEADQRFCEERLAICPDFESSPDRCQELETQKGKEDCGLAIPAGGAPP